jgi:hypothetical protein
MVVVSGRVRSSKPMRRQLDIEALAEIGREGEGTVVADEGKDACVLSIEAAQ